jgi:beta-phosphoglucomutase
MDPWPRAILFDFDGVIVNSEPLHYQAFHEVLKDQNINVGEEEYYRDLIGFDDTGFFKHVYQSRQRDLTPGMLLGLMTRKGEMTMELIQRRHYQALPGVEEFVRGLWRHYPLAICSGARRDEIEAMLEGVNLRDCFPDIVAAEDVKCGKPDPEGYLLAAKLVSKRSSQTLKPGCCLIVEDAPTVVESVHKAGFKVLAVTTCHPAEHFGKANYVVNSLRPTEVVRKIPELKVNP